MKLNRIITILLLSTVFGLTAHANENMAQAELDFAKKAVKDGFFDLAESKLNTLLLFEVSKDTEAEAHLLMGKTN